jgi:pyruvate formate lyase activating enzyme
MTLSGGEPLMQPGFTRALLREGKRRGLHTTLDTCGKASREVFQSLLPYLDLVLYDVKHTDPDVHAEAVGSDNRVIMKNLEFLSGKVDIWLRVPLIPDFNDEHKVLEEIVELAGSVDVDRLCFLPYHRWGSGKYAGLGREYPRADIEDIPTDKLQEIETLCASAGVTSYEIAST